MDLTWLTHVWPLTWLIHSALKSCCEAAAAPHTPTAPPTCRCVPPWRRVRRKWRQTANMSSSFPSLEMSLRHRSYYITTVIYIYTFVHLYTYMHISIHIHVYFRENEDRTFNIWSSFPSLEMWMDRIIKSWYSSHDPFGMCHDTHAYIFSTEIYVCDMRWCVLSLATWRLEAVDPYGYVCRTAWSCVTGLSQPTTTISSLPKSGDVFCRKPYKNGAILRKRSGNIERLLSMHILILPGVFIAVCCSVLRHPRALPCALQSAVCCSVLRHTIVYIVCCTMLQLGV